MRAAAEFYPWPVPTVAQQQWFASLSADEQQRLIDDMLADAELDAVSDKTPSEILSEVLARPMP